MSEALQAKPATTTPARYPGREFVAPSTFTLAPDASMADNVYRFAEEDPTHIPYRRMTANGWVDVTAREFADQVRAVAKGLIASGVEFGDRVAIMSATRYEWVLIDYAIWSIGACTVAIYETSSPEQVKWILEDSGTTVLLVENDARAAVAGQVVADAPELREVLQIEVPGGADAIGTLITRGADVPDTAIAERRAKVGLDTPATLIYTSGTTGRPKGVQLTHGNCLAESAADRIGIADAMQQGQRTILFLPLAHILARAISFGAFDAKVTVGHYSDISTLVQQFAEFKPNFILSVPRVFEKVYNAAKQKAEDGGKGSIFAKATDTAIAYSKAKQAGRIPLALKAKHKLFDVLVYGKLRAALGGECDRAISGGAALGERLGHFFNGIGVPIYEGYGLTETTAAITLNTTSHHRIGSVGRPIDGQAAAVAEDGELLLRGSVVFTEYWHNPEATREAFADGWFHTGDLATIDDEGYVRIVGRKKEIIVTAGGKNIAPAVLEDTLRAHPLISQALVVGEGKPYVAALLTLDPETLPGWLERNNLPADTPVDELTKLPELIAELDVAVEEANQHVSHAEGIKRYRVVADDFTIESGELTPTLKLKRNVIYANRTPEIEAIYA